MPSSFLTACRQSRLLLRLQCADIEGAVQLVNPVEDDRNEYRQYALHG